MSLQTRPKAPMRKRLLVPVIAAALGVAYALAGFLLAPWIAEGKIKGKETIEHGIENAPEAFLKLFTGQNLGKMLVKLG